MQTQGFFRYDATFDVSNTNDSHTITALTVGSDKKVLDVGCSVAVIAPYLRSKNCTVVGIDSDTEALEVARQRCDQVYHIDLNHIEQLASCVSSDFDVILCNDVLEHVLEPDALLKALRTHLNDTGFLIASIPNVAHGSVRLGLWRGQWTYRSTGLLDRTHLHFYTKESIGELFSRTGWFIAQWSNTTAPYQIDLDVPLSTYPSQLLEELDADPAAQAYQYVLKAYKRESMTVAELLETERAEWERERENLQGVIAERLLQVEQLSALRVDTDARVEQLSAEVQNLRARIILLGNEKEQLMTQHQNERVKLAVEYRTEIEQVLAEHRSEMKAMEAKNRELTRLIAAIHHQLGLLRTENRALQTDITDVRQERDVLRETAERYRYLYESLRFSRAGRMAHRIGSVKTFFKAIVRMWGSPRQFRAMFSKASKVLMTEGPVQLARYGANKLTHPELRYNETLNVLNAEEDVEGYQVWIHLHRITEEIRDKMVENIESWTWTPTVSIVMPVYNVHPKWLLRAVDSVREQVYPYWELCMVDDASTAPATVKYLSELEAERDPRIRVLIRAQNGGISAATNDGLKMAQGEFIALMDNDDELAEQALYRIVDELQREPDADILYSDEDKIDEQGKRFAPFFKPEWSPTLLLGMNYVSHLGVYRRSLVESVGGFRSEFDGAQDYDFLLRCSEQTERIVHIPDVLYHWRTLSTSTALEFAAKPYVADAALNALSDHLVRQNIDGSVDLGKIPARFRIKCNVAKSSSVSVVIPTKDRLDLLQNCLEGLERTVYPESLEIVIVDNGSSDPKTLEFLKACPHKIVSCPGPFNFSFLINQGVAASSGDGILILNNDIEVLSDDWLTTMVGHLQMPGVGVVGPKLLYPDGRIQHSGIIVGLGGIAGHAFWLNPGDAYGYFGLQQVSHEVAAVTGACLLTRRDIYDQVEGFREDFPVNFNDVAYCLDVRSRGYRVVYCPDASLVHRESASRKPHVEPWEEARFRDAYEITDPFYSPHLSLLPAHVYGLPLPGEEKMMHLS